MQQTAESTTATAPETQAEPQAVPKAEATTRTADTPVPEVPAQQAVPKAEATKNTADTPVPAVPAQQAEQKAEATPDTADTPVPVLAGKGKAAAKGTAKAKGKATAKGKAKGKTNEPPAEPAATDQKPHSPDAKVNYFEVFSVGRSCTAAEVDTVYKRLALLHHPDKGDKQNGSPAKHYLQFGEIGWARTLAPNCIAPSRS